MPLKLYKRGRFWWYSGTVAKRRLRGSTGATDKGTAERVAAEVEHLAWNRRFDGPGAGLTMAQAFIRYLDDEKSDRFIAANAAHWKDTLVSTITAEAIRQSAKKIYPGAANATWNRQVIVPTMAAINHCSALGWCAPIKVKRFPENSAKKTPADLAWVKSFVAQADADRLPELATLCLFMFATAARVGEACRLTWADVDLSKSTAIVRIYKPTPWTREAHLPATVVAALANFGGNRNPNELVFGYAGRGSVTKVWNNVVERAGIDPLTPHCCRHGFATSMLQKGFDPKTVAERGGWKDATTVLRVYAHALKDRTVTDALFDTELTQPTKSKVVTSGKNRRKPR